MRTARFSDFGGGGVSPIPPRYTPWRQTLPLVDRMTDRRFWNTTLPQTSFAGGKFNINMCPPVSHLVFFCLDPVEKLKEELLWR